MVMVVLAFGVVIPIIILTLSTGTAEEALAQLDAQVATWLAGVEALGDEGLAQPCGPAEGPYAAEPLATLVLHIHRGLIHHGAEISLLRDLYAHRHTDGS